MAVLPDVRLTSGTAWPGARVGVLMAYFFNGLAISSWMARLPDFETALHIGSAEMGGVLLAAAVGTLVTVTVAGVAVVRLGAAATYVVATVGFVASYLFLGFSAARADLPMLVVAQVIHGAAFALTNVPMSTMAAAIQRTSRRTILPQFHASYAIGAVVGAALGAVASAHGVALLPQLIVLSVAAVVVRSVVVFLVRACSRDVRAEGRLPQDASADRSEWTVRRRVLSSLSGIFAVWAERRTMLIGAIVFAAALSEGAANNWVSIASVGSFGVSAATGAVAYTVFLAAETVVRLGGGRLIDVLGRARTLAGSGVAAVVGLVLFAVAPTFPVALVGVGLWGVGAALATPLGIAAAGEDPRLGPSRIAAVTSLSSIANIAGPPLIGIAGGVIGLRPALVFIVVFLGLGVAVSRAAMAPAGPPSSVDPHPKSTGKSTV